MASADTLFDPLRVPGQIVIYYEIAKLEVDAFRRRLSCDHDGRLIPEIFHDGGPLIGGRRTADTIGTCVLFQPSLIDISRLLICARAVEQNDLTAELGPFEDTIKILLGAPGLRENERLLLKRGSALILLGFGRSRKTASEHVE